MLLWGLNRSAGGSSIATNWFGMRIAEWGARNAKHQSA